MVKEVNLPSHLLTSILIDPIQDSSGERQPFGWQAALMLAAVLSTRASGKAQDGGEAHGDQYGSIGCGVGT
jgi:hypothetical protein